jgi:hypothetical protein
MKFNAFWLLLAVPLVACNDPGSVRVSRTSGVQAPVVPRPASTPESDNANIDSRTSFVKGAVPLSSDLRKKYKELASTERDDMDVIGIGSLPTSAGMRHTSAICVEGRTSNFKKIALAIYSIKPETINDETMRIRVSPS